jgi:release factor glutamine methyltransferase
VISNNGLTGHDEIDIKPREYRPQSLSLHLNDFMANSKIVFQEIQSNLKSDDRDEVRAISLVLMEKYFHVALSDIIAEKEVESQNLSSIIARLNQHEPLQYILGEAEFFGRKFKVNPTVLIPRPETELLVQAVLQTKLQALRILDIGTGSGCIAITLNLEIPDSKVYAIDVSQDALQVAGENANQLGSTIEFFQSDFLNNSLNIESVDIIVSNPPYIRELEKNSMALNVLNFEPHQALFIPDDDPLLFYKAIATKGKALLKPGGKIFVEINEKFGTEIKNLLLSSGFREVNIIQDLDRKDRIAFAQL